MSVSKLAEKYVGDNPSIKDSLQKGLINYSKLSRQMISELGLKDADFDAILVSLTRLERKLKKKSGYQRKIKEILKKTRLEVKTKIMVCIVENDIFYQNLVEMQKEIKKMNGFMHIVEGTNAITLITDQCFEGLMKRFFKSKIISIKNDLVEIVMVSPDSLENVPGVTGYLYSLFSDRGINIVETLSCWTDTFLVIEKKDLDKAMEVLDF